MGSSFRRKPESSFSVFSKELDSGFRRNDEHEDDARCANGFSSAKVKSACHSVTPGRRLLW